MNLKAQLTKISYQEVLYYLGYRSQKIDNNLQIQIERCIEIIQMNAKPMMTYKIFDVENGKCESFPFIGKDANRLAKDATKIVIVAATIGNDVERILRRYEIINAADALIMDACASVAIENVCENLEQDIRSFYGKNGLYVSDRFSPGYGDFPLSMQKQFCDFLSTDKRIGVHVTDSYIMTPRKSVTAFMAVQSHPFKLRKKGCEVCSLFIDCEFRKVGKYCGK